MLEFLSLAGIARSALAAVVQWLSRRSLAEIICICLSLALILTGYNRNHWKHVATERQAQLVACKAGRAADRKAYVQAQKDAAAKNLATVARDKAERERITHDISQSYENELASLRADLARRLRATPQGSAGKPGLPDVSQAPSGPDAGSRVSIPTSLYVRGAELELQLERLQQWVAEQVKVDPNK